MKPVKNQSGYTLYYDKYYGMVTCAWCGQDMRHEGTSFMHSACWTKAPDWARRIAEDWRSRITYHGRDLTVERVLQEMERT